MHICLQNKFSIVSKGFYFEYCLRHQIEKDIADCVWRMWQRKDAYRVLVRKPEGKRPLEKLNLRWEDNIKMYVQEVGWRHGLNCSGSE